MDFCPYLFCLSFLSFIFYLPPFKDNGLPFWVPDVLCQHSEVVLWNLLSIQMFFWWICEGESGLPVLFLCRLRTASWRFLLTLIIWYSSISRMLNVERKTFILEPNKHDDHKLLIFFFSFCGVWLFSSCWRRLINYYFVLHARPDIEFKYVQTHRIT